MKIVTGYGGTDHITSNDWQGLNQGIIGTDSYVLNVGNKFAATMPDATHVNISDGEGVLQGVHFRTEPGTTDSVTIDAGSSGSNRIDLICARYTKNSTTGVENVEWVVIKGTAVSGDPSAPSYTTGDVLGGDTQVDFPLYQVTLTGTTVGLTSIYNRYPRIWRLYKETNDRTITTTSYHTQTDYALPNDGMYEVIVNARINTKTASLEEADLFIGDASLIDDVATLVAIGTGPTICLNVATLVDPGSKVRINVDTLSTGTIGYNVRIYYRPLF